MYARSLHVIGDVWACVLLGTLLILVGVGAGWSIAGQPRWLPVRFVAWWVRRIVLPLLSCRLWWRRAATIYLNNISILTVLLAMGHWRLGPLFGVAGLGLSLGMALRVLSNLPMRPLEFGAARCNAHKRRIRLGVALNLLEPPAIMLTIGLSIAQRAIPLTPSQAWETFALWVVPATLLAAGGEALWLGVGQGAQTVEDGEPPGDAEP